MKDGKEFSQLIEEYGALEKSEAEVSEEDDAANKGAKAKAASAGAGTAKQAEGKKMELMQEEERNRGSVAFSVYANYLKHAGGIFWAPVIILLLTLMQGASGILCIVSSHPSAASHPLSV